MSGSAQTAAVRLPRPAYGPRLGSALLSRGIVVTWLSVMVLIPLAAIVVRSTDDGLSSFWDYATNPQALDALKLTVLCSLGVAAINVVIGTAIAWVLVRDEFPGKRLVNSMIDLPFALPTIVASLTLLSLYGADSPLGIDLAFTRAAIVVALCFVTLPFVVRAVQPTLIELDRDMEEAAASLGASRWTIFRRIVVPNLRPAILAGAALAFARAIGEFGSLILLSGNIPGKTEVASVFIFGQIESGNTTGAAAVSVVLLVVSLAVLLALGAVARRGEVI
jgi:sulfate transport system permease protein